MTGKLCIILLDTHVLLWWATQQQQRLSTPAREAVDAEQKSGKIAISSISAWEIAMLIQRKRLALSMDLREWLAIVEQLANVRFIAVDNGIAVESENLPGEFHRDPADRMIVATARKLGATLITMDDKIRSYPHVRTTW
jgi:PIN domain nuclease of toxin-antitoxin system